ncbi:hypothetical protein RBSH_02928 [Rhodopirellula baltica SH28]|uniref:Uncharacterized protein n=2 Tax=Rhodopirellula baltica TaxID=265606 RepID=F2ALN8_RHOBT|nr:hypothetical protein RBWH47_00419 [Rhodopirellula baltica WH47]EKK01798.1 hypothetical protein RBSH_02928 [Rhodopirellula baltica SH28]
MANKRQLQKAQLQNARARNAPNSHDGPIRDETQTPATIHLSNVPCSDTGHTERSDLQQETLFSVASQAP